MTKQSPVADTVEAWMTSMPWAERERLFDALQMPRTLTSNEHLKYIRQVLKWLNEPLPVDHGAVRIMEPGVKAPVPVTAGRVDRGPDANMQPVRDAEQAYQRGKVSDNQLDTLLSYYRNALATVRVMPDVFGTAIVYDLQMRQLRVEDMIARRQT